MNTMIGALGKVSEVITLSLPIVSVISLLIPKVRKWLKRAIQNLIGLPEIKDNINESNKRISEMQEEVSKIKSSLEHHLENDNEKIKAQMYNLKDSLMRSFHFYIDRGYITLEELSTLQDVYNSYRKFGGNGVFKALWEDKIMKLPNEPIKV